MQLNNKLALFSLTWPILIETFLRLFMGNVNVFMLGHYSDSAVAAIGVMSQVTNMFIIVYGVIATGTAIIVTQYLGAGNEESASRTAIVAMITNLIFGIVISLMLLFCAGAVASVMNFSGDTYAYAVRYLQIVGAASFMQALIATIGAVFRSYGVTKLPMVVALTMNTINIAGNYLSLFKPFGLPVYGVTGVALSIVVSSSIGIIIMLVQLARRFAIIHLLRQASTASFQVVKDILKIGIPSAAEALSYTGSQIVVTYMVGFLGAEVLAARVYTSNISMLVYMLSLSIGQGTQILIGHLIGAGKLQDAYQTSLRSLKMSFAANLVMSLLLIVLRKPVMELFTDSAPIINLAMTILLVDLMVQLGRAGNHVLNGSLRAAGDVKYAMLVNVTSMWGVGVVLCYLLGWQLHWGLIGVWLASGMDEWTRSLLLLKRWISRKWEQMRLVKT